MRRILTLVLLLAACAGGAVYAMDPVDNNLDATDVSKTWTIASSGPGYKSLQWNNLGASTVYVCIFRVGEAVAACTTGTGVPVLATGIQSFGSDPEDPGIVAATYICLAGQTSDNNAGLAWGRARAHTVNVYR
jgi:hypothetical protein